jgi:hypothetical protein
VQQHDRQRVGRGSLEETRDALADHRSHASAHERKIEAAVGDAAVRDSPAAHLYRLRAVGVAARALEPLGVALAVVEAERIARRDVFVPALERPDPRS